MTTRRLLWLIIIVRTVVLLAQAMSAIESSTESEQNINKMMIHTRLVNSSQQLLERMQNTFSRGEEEAHLTLYRLLTITTNTPPTTTITITFTVTTITTTTTTTTTTVDEVHQYKLGLIDVLSAWNTYRASGQDCVP